MMRRRFRRKAHWVWADRQRFTSVQATGTANVYGVSSLLPPGRTTWLLNNTMKGRNSLTVRKIHLWLDFWWRNGSAGVTGLPDVYFFVKKVKQDEAGTPFGDYQYDPFVQPQVPANITAWDASPTDGTDRFLWSHYIRGSSPPNAIVRTAASSVGTSSTDVVNQSDFITNVSTTGNGDAFVCRTFRCAQEWQPDVIVRSAVKLERDEGIAIVMFTPGLTTPPATPTLQFQCRVLAS